MRIHCSVRLALLLLIIAAPLLACAQFQQPTEEELKMTSDPKAPGAAAVYLYREETSDDSLKIQSYYERIKVLTEKGKELATVRIPYEHGEFKVTDIQGRTIHPDGTVIPLTAKPDDVMAFKLKKFQINAIVFTLPSVEVGSILEYRLSLRFNESMPLPTWDIQQPWFVHKAHYSYHFINPSCFLNLAYTSKIDSGVKLVNGKHDLYTLDIEDVPPLPDEDWMPPLNIFRWRVNFYYTRATSSDEFWKTAGKSWADPVDEFTKPSSNLKKVVAEIVEPTDTDEQKAKKIYAALQKLDNTGFSREKSAIERKKEKIKDINNVEDIWKRKSATPNGIVFLYIALLRTAGLKAWPMQLVDRNRATFDYSYLSTNQLDDYIAIVEIDGKDVFLDPGQKMCPFGTLHWKHSLASGLRSSDKGAVLGTTPAINYKSAGVKRVANLNVDGQGNVNGTAQLVMSGPDALFWRQLALENDEEEVSKQFNESLREYLPDGVQGDFDHFLSLDDYSVNLTAIIKISGTLGAATGKHFFLPGLFFESRASHPFVAQDKRITPVDVHYARMEQDDVTYHLPPGFSVESAPKTPDVTWQRHAALRIDSTVDSGSVEVFRTFARGFAILDPKEYKDLHDFYQKLATADQQQLVLTRATPAKGN